MLFGSMIQMMIFALDDTGLNTSMVRYIVLAMSVV